MGYIIINRDSEEMEGMRSNMRRSMRGGYRSYGGSGVSMRSSKNDEEEMYRMGYRHGWEDKEDEEAEYRRQRDSRGRYM